MTLLAFVIGMLSLISAGVAVLCAGLWVLSLCAAEYEEERHD